MNWAKHIQEMVDYEVEKQKKKAETQSMTEYFNKLLPSEVQEVARKSAHRTGRVLRRSR